MDLGSSGGSVGLWGALGQLGEALGALRGLGRALGGSGGAPEELWEDLYKDKLPINRPSGRYVIFEPQTSGNGPGRY